MNQKLSQGDAICASLVQLLDELDELSFEDDPTPLILIPNPTTREEHRSTYTKNSRVFFDLGAELSKLAARIKRSRRRLHQHQTSTLNALSPFAGLPVEILDHILQLALSPAGLDHGHRLARRRDLMLVCRGWRHSIASRGPAPPRTYKKISAPDVREVVETTLNRLQDPTSLRRIDIREGTPDPNSISVNKELYRAVETLDLSVSDPFELLYVMREQLDIQTLVIRKSPFSDVSVKVCFCQRLEGSFKNLSHLIMDGPCYEIDRVHCGGRISTLTFRDGAYVDSRGFGEAISPFLRKFRHLKRLCVDEVTLGVDESSDSEDSDEEAALEFPSNIQDVTISGEPFTAQSIFDSEALSADVKRLTLRFKMKCEDGFFRSLDRFASNNHIENLRLESATPFFQDALTLLLPSNSRRAARSAPNTSNSSANASIPFIHLAELTLLDFCGANWQANTMLGYPEPFGDRSNLLIWLVGERAREGYPLQELVVSECLVGGNRNAEWLRDNLGTVKFVGCNSPDLRKHPLVTGFGLVKLDTV